MTSIQEVTDHIYNKVSPKSPQEFVSAFEKYVPANEKIDSKLSQIEYDNYSRLVADYGIALNEIKAYKNSVPILERALSLLRENSSILKEDLKNLEFYEALLFRLGLSHFYLEDYNSAKLQFKLLQINYSHNSTYSKWLFTINNRLLNKVTSILWYCVASSTILVSLFRKSAYGNVFLVLIIISLVTVITLELVSYSRRKKYGV